MKFLRPLLASLLLTVSAFAADDAAIVINKGAADSKLIPISISGYSGEVDKVVRFDLSIMGFELVPADRAQYQLTGANTGNVEGRLIDAQSKESKLAKAYSGGSARVQAHALADDVVQAILGVPGVARTKIVFKRDLGSTGEIYVSDFDGFNPIAITSDNAIVASPTWGAAKKTLYYTSYRATYPDIYAHDLGTGERKIFANFPGSNLSPSVSRDGRRVAMILSKGGSPDVYVANADRSNLVQLTKTKDDESSPTWSPDGTRICYAAREDRALYIVSANGGSPRRLNTSGAPSPSEPDWSPDGKTIIFTSHAGGLNFNLHTVPADGSSAPTLLVAGEHASWAPNSRTVVFARRENNRRVLSLLDVPSKTVKSLPSNLGSCSQPCWSK
jgi:TolB protein